MSGKPQTLMQMAGAPACVPILDECTLLLIDFQCQYLGGPTKLEGVNQAIETAGRLLETCRNAGVPVVHISHQGRTGGLFDPQTSKVNIVPQLEVRVGETHLNKALPNSFAGTQLQEVLKEAGREKLIVAGFMTHMCVSSTVRAGVDLGWNSFVVADACATRDLPDPVNSNKVITARDIHQASLAALSDRFATIVSCNQVA